MKCTSVRFTTDQMRVALGAARVCALVYQQTEDEHR
jgi:hypothetical protein